MGDPQDIFGNVSTVLNIYSLNVGAKPKPLLSLKLMSSCLSAQVKKSNLTFAMF